MRSLRGMTLIDVLIGISLMLIIFTGLTSLLSTSLKVSVLAKTHGNAIAIAESQLEYVRSLSYDSIGTVGGIPAGNIPQYATTTQNGLSFVTRTYIAYVDSPADGLGSADVNGITSDYKVAKVTTTYYVSGIPYTVVLISNFAPIGIESTAGGGTLKISVVNAVGAGVAGASVHIVNASTSPLIDFTTFSDSTGIVYLPGAPASSQYQVTVTKIGYSTAKNYARDATNQNPTPGYSTVAVNQTTTATFVIDQLGTLIVRTFSPIVAATYGDAFQDSTGVSATSNTVAGGGAVTLSGGPATYAPSGSVVSVGISPTYLYAWGSAGIIASLPATTGVIFHIADTTGALLADTVLPGNASGYASMVDLSGISVAIYPTLKLVANLTTGDPTVTPTLANWSVGYQRGPIPLPNIAFSLSGTKTIGSTGMSVPIVKTTIATTTQSTGVVSLPLEWDSYAMTLNGYDVISACPAPDYALAPGATLDSSLILGSSTAQSLAVSVRDVGATPLSGAAVTLSRTGYTNTVSSNNCGSAYFGSLANASDYTISIVKSGYTTYTASNISVSGHTFYGATLNL
jgi:type II secretory pathway pseudopilin PulG